jgi:hypothetical protein
MQKDAVIVFEAGEQVRFGWHNWLATPAWQRQATTPFPGSMWEIGLPSTGEHLVDAVCSRFGR